MIQTKTLHALIEKNKYFTEFTHMKGCMHVLQCIMNSKIDVKNFCLKKQDSVISVKEAYNWGSHTADSLFPIMIMCKESEGVNIDSGKLAFCVYSLQHT